MVLAWLLLFVCVGVDDDLGVSSGGRGGDDVGCGVLPYIVSNKVWLQA